MTAEFNLIFIYYSYLLISVIGIRIIGSLVSKPLILLSQNSVTSFFLDMFCGLMTLVIAYSIISTNGITVSLGYIFLFLFYLLYRNFDYIKEAGVGSSFVRNISYKGLNIEFLVVISVFFIMQAYSISNANDGLLYIPVDPDRSLFSDVIGFMNTSGVESYKIDYINPESVGATPYHYLELWVTGFIVALFSSNILITDHLVSAPIFGLITYVGFRAISEIFNVSRSYSIIASFLVVGMNLGVQFPWIEQFHELLGRTGVYFQLSVLEYPKFFGIYLFQIAAIIFYYNKRNFLALICLLSIPVTNILMAPSILFSAGFMLILGYYKKKISTKQFYFGVVATLSIAIFIMLFYQIFGKEELFQDTANVSRLISEGLDSIFSLTSINIIVGTSIQIIYMLFPFIIISIWMRKNMLSYLRNINIIVPILLWTFFVILGGLISWVIIQNHPESTQLSIRFAFVATNLISFIIIMLAYNYKYVGWAFLLIIFFIKLDYSYLELNNKRIESSNFYSQEFLLNVEEKFKGISPKGVFIRKKSELLAVRSKSILVRIGSFTNLYNSGVDLYPMNISDFTDSISNNYTKSIIEKSSINSTPFYKFVNKQRLNKNFKSINSSQYDFIIKHNINFLILEHLATLPKNIEALVQMEFIDKKSGERLYILHNEL